LSKRFEFSIVAKFKDLASRGLKRLGKTAKASLFGSRGIMGSLGLGGLATGGIFGAVIGAARTAVGAVLGIVRGAINAAIGIVRAGIRIISGIIRTVVKVAAGVGLAAGAALGWQLAKGIRENMQLADIRMVLRKLLGDGAKDAEQYARKLSLATPFTPMEMLRATTGLATVRGDYRRFLSDLADWAAGAQVPLEQLVDVFARAKTGQLGEAMEGIRRARLSLLDLQNVGARFNRQNQFLGTPDQFIGYMMKAARKRYKGMAAAAAEVGSGPWSTLSGHIQNIRTQLTEPWYERFNQGLKDMNGWLLRLVGGEGFEKLRQRSAGWARVVDEKLRVALRGLVEFDWSPAGMRKWVETTRERINGLFDDVKAFIRDLIPVGKALIDALISYAQLGMTTIADALDRHVTGMMESVAKSLREVGVDIQQKAQEGSWAGQWEAMTGSEKVKQAAGHPLSTLWAVAFKSLGPAAAAQNEAGKLLHSAGMKLDDAAIGIRNAADRQKQAATDAQAAWARLKTELGQLHFGGADAAPGAVDGGAAAERKFGQAGNALREAAQAADGAAATVPLALDRLINIGETLAHAQQILDAQVGAAFGRIQRLELRVKSLGTSKS